jgi:hypothetical protein
MKPEWLVGLFVVQAEARWANLVLVGDHETASGHRSGIALQGHRRADWLGCAIEIRWQKENLQREASIAFATYRTSDALASYAARGALEFSDGRDKARSSLVRGYLADLEQHPSDSRIALAQTRSRRSSHAWGRRLKKRCHVFRRLLG